MKYRKLAKSDLQLSEIGFGVWTIAAGWWGDYSDEQACERRVVAHLLQAVVRAGSGLDGDPDRGVRPPVVLDVPQDQVGPELGRGVGHVVAKFFLLSQELEGPPRLRRRGGWS